MILPMPELTPIQQIRQRNFARLVRERYGNNNDAARAWGMSASQVSNYARGTRGMGEKLARRIERAAKLADGSLSIEYREHEQPQAQIGIPNEHALKINDNLTDRSHNRSTQERVFVQNFHEWQSAGSSNALPRVSVSASLLARHGLSVDDVKYIEMPDESQSDRIRAGDLVVINVAWDGDVKSDQVYALMIGGVLTLRKAEVLPNTDVVLKCHSERYTDTTIKSADLPSLDIAGVVITFEPQTLNI